MSDSHEVSHFWWIIKLSFQYFTIWWSQVEPCQRPTDGTAFYSLDRVHLISEASIFALIVHFNSFWSISLTWHHHNSFHFIWEELNRPMRIKQLRISKLKIRISSRKVKTKRSSRSEGTCAEGLNPTHNWLIYNPLYLRIVREQNIAA